MKKLLAITMAGILALLFVSTAVAKQPTTQSMIEELGKLLYFDRHLSLNQNQSCASCHDPNAGWADPLNLRLPEEWQFSAGSDTTLKGGRNAPPAGYAMFSPPFFGDGAGFYTGGQFWDGRAPTLADQAKGPFLNPVEMAMPSKAAVIAAMIDPANPNAADYLGLFRKAYNVDLNLILADPAAVISVYDMVGEAIGEFEKTAVFAPFASKWDEVQVGKATFTAEEAAGELVFNGIGQCHLCHPAPLFTDFTYDNLGIPQLLPGAPVDLGLGAGDNTLVLPADLLAQEGKFKVSSLRNIEMTPPYGHNGYFATLDKIVHFYNTRDVDPMWP